MTTTALPATASRSSFLHRALQLDAVVTGANGAAYLALAGPLGDLLGHDPALLRGLGAFLLAFAACVALAARADMPSRAAVTAIVVANAAWAAGSIVAAIAGWGDPSTAGTVWTVLQALTVAAFAELQLIGLRKAR